MFAIPVGNGRCRRCGRDDEELFVLLASAMHTKGYCVDCMQNDQKIARMLHKGA